MARHSHPLYWLLCVPCLAAGLGLSSAVRVTAGDHGYLPAVGPPPLRFAPPRPTGTSTLTLAEVPAIEPVTNARVNVAAAPASTNPPPGGVHGEPTSTAAPPASVPEWFGPPAPPLPSPTPLPPINPAWLVPNASQTVMPQAQLFLQYFTPEYLPGSNAAGLVVPVGFVPPQPRSSSSSSATYQVTPGGTGTGTTASSATK